jgi:microcin C transport system permease protein
MGAYIVRRLFLIIPTLLGILTINFIIIQAAPGGPVERTLAQLQGMSASVMLARHPSTGFPTHMNRLDGR